MRNLLLVLVLSVLSVSASASAQGVYQGCPINVSPYVRCGNTIVSTATPTTYVAPAYSYATPTYFSYGTTNYSYQPYVIPQQTYAAPQYVVPQYVVQPTTQFVQTATFGSPFGYSTFSSAPVRRFGASTFSSAPVVRLNAAPTVQTFSGAPSFGSYNAAAYGTPTVIRVRGRRR